MVGRGAVADPTLPLALRGIAVADKRALIRALHDRVLEENCRRMGTGKNLLCRMADIWNYQSCLFIEAEQVRRRIRQAATLAEYRAAAALVFREYPFAENGAYRPREQ